MKEQKVLLITGASSDIGTAFIEKAYKKYHLILAQKICQCGTNASGKQPPNGTKHNAGKDDDSIARMDVSSGSGSRNAD